MKMKSSHCFIGGLTSILILAYFFFSCRGTSSESKEPMTPELYQDSFGVKLEIDTLILKVDSLTVIPQNSQLVSNDSILFFFNKSLNALEFYHLHGNAGFERILLEKEGPNGIGSHGNIGVYYFSEDTLVVTSVNNLLLMTKRGEVYKRMRIDLENLGSFPDFMIQGTKPVWKRNNRLIISVFPHLNTNKKSDLKKWNNFLQIDLDSSEFSSFGSLPAEMQSKIFGINYLNHSCVFNDKNEIILSFSPLNSLFRISLDRKHNLEEIELEDRYFKDAPSLKHESNSDMQYVLSHYLLNNSFDGIFFNGSQYLRITQNPLSEGDYNNKSWAKTKNIIFYNNEFEPLCFWNTGSKSISYNMIFPTKDGFLLRIGSKEEDEFRFIHVKNCPDEEL